MLSSVFNILSPYFQTQDPEEAHLLTLKMLKYYGMVPTFTRNSNTIQLMGLDFPNRLGVAAGFDKNAEAIDGLFRLGFGFVEIGTVTPLPQKGNEKPRLFRLKEDQAVINRMGFNNDGAEMISKRLKKRRYNGQDGIVGVNIGANKDSDDRVRDYALCASAFTDVASYFTVNVSSPNTEGLRDLQAAEYLLPLLQGVLNVVETSGQAIPVLLKIAPDLMQEDIEEIADIVNNMPVAGIIATNTTLSRPDMLQSKDKGERGGLSGAPLLDISNNVTSVLRSLLLPEKIIIGAGGIKSADTARQKLDIGADLLQIYSCLVYQGPQLINEILNMLEALASAEKSAYI